jgi:lipopolysaccharide transport system permease protein
MARHLFLLRELVKRDFQGRYAGSLLGFVWSLVQPLWLLVLFSFVFATVMKVSPVGSRTDSFGVFLFAGLAPWMGIHEGVLRGSTAITDNAQLVKKLSFPAEVLVLAVVLAALLHQAIALGVFVVVLASLGELSLATLPLLLVAVPLQVAFTLGLGLLVASAHVFFRDTSQVLSLLFQAWFYLTPIVYPLAWVPERFRPAIELNPLTPLVDLYRQALLGTDFALSPAVAGLAGVAAVLLAAGLWVFRRVKPAFVDEI